MMPRAWKYGPRKRVQVGVAVTEWWVTLHRVAWSLPLADWFGPARHTTCTCSSQASMHLRLVEPAVFMMCAHSGRASWAACGSKLLQVFGEP